MKNFWSYIDNGKFAVGCTGKTVHVYDSAGTELAKFRDLSYAYLPLFSPDGTLLAVKSTAGLLAFYTLAELRLLKKFRFTPLDGCQDGNMCFSPDGSELYNIEVSEAGDARITVYSVKNFLPVADVHKEKEIVPIAVERDGEFVHLQNCGFTKKAEEWSALRYAGYDLTGIEKKDYSVFRLWKEREFSDYPPNIKY